MFGLISKKRLTKEIVELYERASDDYFNSPPSENSFHYCCGNHNALNYLSYVFNLGITEIIKDNNHQKFFKKYWQAPKEHVESKWIPVSERLPETDNTNEINEFDVLLAVRPKKHPERTPQVYIGKQRPVEGDDGSGNFWDIKIAPCKWTIWGWSYFQEPEVLAWMPLPKAYEVTK